MLILRLIIERNYWVGYIFLYDVSFFVLYGIKKWKMKYKFYKKIYVLKMRLYFVIKDLEKWCFYIIWEVCKLMKYGNGLDKYLGLKKMMVNCNYL